MVTTIQEFRQLPCEGGCVVLFLSQVDSPVDAASEQLLVALEHLQKDFPSVKCFQVAIREKVVLSAWNDVIDIKATPTVGFFLNKRLVQQIEGVDVPKLVSQYQDLATRAQTKVPEKATSAAEISAAAGQDRLRQLTTMAPVVIFMKGAKAAPFCRFSKQAVAIMNQLKCDFESFDVFTDDTVREGMKTFSNWPTFPQLYVDGEFIGGVSIMEEMMKSGELQEILKKYCRS